MTEDQPIPQNTTIPIIKDNELRLAKMRRQLEGMCRSLDLVHDEIRVASDAARSAGQPEIANVLALCVCNPTIRPTQITHQHHREANLSEEPVSTYETTQTTEERS